MSCMPADRTLMPTLNISESFRRHLRQLGVELEGDYRACKIG
jgi:hypothetical protein